MLVLLKKLDFAGIFEHNLLCTIACIFEHTTDERLKLYTMSKYDQCASLIRKLKANTAASLKDELITHESLLRKFSEQY